MRAREQPWSNLARLVDPLVSRPREASGGGKMFYGSSSGASMSLPSKSRLKRQSRTFTQVLYRTLSYRDRVPAEAGTDGRGRRGPERPEDDPSELSSQSSAPGVLKIFGDEICAGANYKSVLATPRSSARELVKEALERYSLNKDAARSYVLCDVIGRLEGAAWRTECLRALADNEKPLVLQELWKPREGRARRFELRRRADVERLDVGDEDTVTAGPKAPQFLVALMGRMHRSSPLRSSQAGSKDINAQARKLQRNRAKGALAPPRSANSSLCRSLSETSLNQLAAGEEPKRYYSTLPGPCRGREAPSGQGGVRHSLYQSPHLLLLQGYNKQDCLVYLLNREQHTVGQETPSARPNICLFSPDVLPLHCRLRRAGPSRVAVEPVPDAAVLVNFSRCRRPTALRHGDLLSFGAHYIFLYKDPAGAEPLPAQTLARLRGLGRLYRGDGPEEGAACGLCGSPLGDGPPPPPVKAPALGPDALRGAHKRRLRLEFEPAHEDRLLDRIVSLIEPGGDDHKLTPAYLLCLCIQHSACAFPPGSFGKLLLKIVRRIQTVAWEKTKELAQKQAQHQDPASLSLLNISDLVPDLQTIFFWMSNSIEILYFIQQRAPSYTHDMETLQGSKESLLSATISANEEAMGVLEEVIMYTFQQCVYYITKALYVVLPGLLDCNPFSADGSEPRWKGGVGIPEPVRRVLQVFESAQELLQAYQVHPEIQAQMFAYLFFFSNVSLFNQLMDKGASRGWFRRSKAVQMQACLRMVREWAREASLGHLADKFFGKLDSAVAVLAAPPQQLTQMSWRALSSEHPSLKPAQLHRLLAQYRLAADTGPVAAWQPSGEDETHIYRTADLLESFEKHPPIVLPGAGFGVDLDARRVDDSVYRQLLYVRHFLWGLRAKTQADANAAHANGDNSNAADVPREPRSGDGGEEKERGGGAAGAEAGRAHLLHPRPPEGGGAAPQMNGYADRVDGPLAAAEGCVMSGCEFPFPVRPSSPGAPPLPDDICVVFVVELDKGPYGLGMGLIDGLHTPLNAPGIYIRTLIPDGPAASDGRLRIGDRILAVNGTSLIGADYQSVG